ncbi:MAG: hypothetical protein E7619_02500 [Ruminococcaceae bacterium]|nr:hypothetical protein [Oscillospiraceae bacterium]
MRKIAICLLIVSILAGATAVFTVGSAAEFSEVNFTDVVQVHTGGGYPRMTVLENGALEYYYQSGYKTSLDSGATFANEVKVKTNAAKTRDVDGVTHALKQENVQAIELSDGTMMVAYRSLTEGRIKEDGTKESASIVDGKFYTSMRVMTRSSYLGTYDNEQVVVESVYETTSNIHGYWEPFLIQLDDTTVAMYYADDLSPADNGANQYIMVVLYDMTTGTWGKPQIAVNKNKDMGREGMPMVARLTDGNYVMAVESHCLQSSRKYIFVIRLWFSQDGINWTNGVVAAAPDVTHSFWDSGMKYNCAAPCVTVLPDGRIAVSYQDNYEGKDNRTYTNTNKTLNAKPCIIISKDKVTYENSKDLVSSTKGISSSFTKLAPNFTEHPTIKGQTFENDVYGIWNSTFYANGYLYFASGMGYNTSTSTVKSLGTYVCRALVDASETPEASKVAAEFGKLNIKRPEQLLQIMNDPTVWSKTIVLKNDIDFADSIYKESRGIGQKSIGYLNTASFKGTFDGQGHTIRGLNINNTVSDYKTGLFGYCDGATIKDCTLYGSVTSTASYTGGFAGYSQNTFFENLTSYVTVKGSTNVGGIAGRLLGGAKGGAFDDCTNYGTVTGTGNNVGGIVGLLDTTTGSTVVTRIENCINRGNVTTTAFAGGICGRINHFNTKGCAVNVTGCINYGNVNGTVTNTYAGGIIGHAGVSDTATTTNNGKLNITFCDNHGNISGVSYVAGIIANCNFEHKSATAKLTLSSCRNYGDIGGDSSVSRIGGIVGRILGTEAARADVSLCYNEGAVNAGTSGVDMGGIIAVAKYVGVSDCESRGSVISKNTTQAKIGGIVGMTNTSAIVENCYFYGTTSYKAVIGLADKCLAANNYYYLVSGTDDTSGKAVTPKSSKTSYNGFSFYDVWYDTVLGPRLLFGKQLKTGDASGDGSVNVLDVAIIQRYLAGWNGYIENIDYFSCDVDRDGVIDIRDAAYLERHLAGWGDYKTLPEN